MADPLLTPTEFAQQIKAKYPDYASVPDDVLATKTLAHLNGHTLSRLHIDAVRARNRRPFTS